MATKTYADTPNSTSNVSASDIIVVQQGNGSGSSGYDQMKQTTLGALKQFMAGDPVKALTYKGSCTYALLPTNPNVGDVWNVTDRGGNNYAWNGTTWDSLGLTLDLSGKADVTYVNNQLSSKEDKSAINYSNRNYIDNPWFTVNQRGRTGGTAYGYMLDRWIFDYGTSSTWAKGANDDYVTLYADGRLIQFIDTDVQSMLVGRRCTVSILDNTGRYHVGTRVLTQAGGDTIINDGYVNVIYSTTKRLYIYNRTTGAIGIRAVKLELGDKSTLAYDSAPNYAEELLKCQRYFVKFTGYTPASTVYKYDETLFAAAIELPTQMRTSPTFTGDFVVGTFNTGGGENMATSVVGSLFSSTKALSFRFRVPSTIKEGATNFLIKELSLTADL